MTQTEMMVWATYGDPNETLDGQMITRQVAQEYAQRMIGHTSTGHDPVLGITQRRIARAFVVADPENEEQGYILVQLTAIDEETPVAVWIEGTLYCLTCRTLADGRPATQQEVNIHALHPGWKVLCQQCDTILSDEENRDHDHLA